MTDLASWRNQGRLSFHIYRKAVPIMLICSIIKAKDLQERTALISFLKENGIQAVFHYIPLHSAPAGKKFGRFNGEDKYTTRESERLMRLPMYYGLKDEEVQYIISKVKEFYK